MSDEFKSLLLEEYKARSDAMAKSEQAGETRVNLFIGLITLVGGGAGTLLTKESSMAALSGERRMLIAVALFSLLVVGTVTLFRLITRNKHTDLCKRQLDYLRQVYKDQFDADGSWAHYDIFPPVPGVSGATPKARVSDRLLPRQFGGLALVVSGLNAILLTVALAVLTRAYGGRHAALNILLMLAILIGAFVVQAWYVRYKEEKGREESKKRYPEDNRAGGVVFRQSGERLEYLLVKAKKSSPELGDRWVLPKGHIDPDESHVQAAVREVAEEAGVAGRPLRLVGRANFKSGEEEVRAKFYLMESIGDVPPHEPRSPAWFSLADACANLQPESRNVLRLAEQRRLTLKLPNSAA